MREERIFSRGAALAFGLLLVVLLTVAPAAAATWDVSDGDSIQAAINNASAGDTVRVHAGTYAEALAIDKSPTQEGIDNPVIQQSTVANEAGSSTEIKTDDIVVQGNAAPSVIAWQCRLGGSAEDFVKSIRQTADGGSIVAGETRSVDNGVIGNHGINDAFVAKLNTDGSIAWQKCFGGSSYDYACDALQTADGGYIVVGQTQSDDGDVTGNHGAWDAWILKLDADGALSWQKCFGGSGSDTAEHIVQTADGEYLFVGGTCSEDGDVSGNHGEYDVWVVKLNADGAFSWQKCLGGSKADSANSVQQTSDGGYVVVGETESNDGDVSGNHGSKDFWVAKLDADGALSWQNCFGSPGSEIAEDVMQASDGGYVVVGQTVTSSITGGMPDNHNNFTSDGFVVKINATGALSWQKCLGGTAHENLYGALLDADGGYVIAGVTSSNDCDVSGNHGKDDAWIVKLDTSGAIVWQRCVGGTGYEIAYDIYSPADGEYVIAGGIIANSDYYDAWATKLGGVQAAPSAGFSTDHAVGHAPLTVVFTDTSVSGIPTSWAWDFDNDGVVDSTEQNPTYIYNTPGNYSVSLRVTNDAGSDSEVKTDYITVVPAGPFTWNIHPGDDLKDIVENTIDAGDTVFLHAGTYTLPGGLTLNNKPNITIRGENRESSIIDAMYKSISFGESANCTLEHLQVIHGSKINFKTGSDNGLVKDCILDYTGNSGSAFGISYNCTVEDNIIDGGKTVVSCTRPFVFRNNTIANTTGTAYAVRVSTTAPVLIEDNTILKSCAAGIQIAKGSNAIVVGNRISSKGTGLNLYKSSTYSPTVYANQFFDNDGGNVVATVPVSEQNWTSLGEIAYTYNGIAYTGSIGNYYDDYTGADADGDGIGDTPYALPDGLGNDTAPLVATLDHYVIIGEAPEPAVLSFDPSPAETGVGGTTEVSIMVDALPAGLAGYNLTVTLDDPSVATITAVDVPTWASLNATGDLPSGNVWIQAADLGESISADAANVTLATLTLTGLSSGMANITATVTRMDGDDGSVIEANVVDGRVFVSAAAAVPGCENLPRDLDGNGICEDVNGNGLFDFDDVVTFFNAIEWMAQNEPAEAFDVNGNGRIDFADLVGLYQEI